MNNQPITTKTRNVLGGAACVVLGLTLAAVAGLFSSSDYEIALLGQATGQLEWGPRLFRVLAGVHGVVLMVVGAVALKGTDGDGQGLSSSVGREPTVGVGWWLAIGLLCVAATALRLIHLESGLWHDEIGTLLNFSRSPVGTILTSFPNQNQHMLYSLLSHGSIALFGESAWSFRLPAALFGVASVPALFLLARRVVDNREALLAGGLLAVSYHHIWFSQNARGYTGVLFFALVATWLFLKALPVRNTWLWCGYVVSVGLGMWVHMTMVFVVAAHGVVYLLLLGYSLWVDPRPGKGYLKLGGRWQPMAAFILGGTMTVHLHALALPHFLRSGLHEVSLESEWINPVWVVVETVKGLQAGFSGSMLAVGAAVVFCGAALVLVGWLSFVRSHWPFALIAALPGVLIFGIMYAMKHNLWPRFVFFCAGFAVLIVVRGAFESPRLLLAVFPRGSWRDRLAGGVGTAVILLMCVASLASLPKYYKLPKQDYEGAMRYIESHRGPGEVVAVVGLARVAYGEYYAVDKPGWVVVADEAEFAALRQKHPGGVWVVYSLEEHLENWFPKIWEIIQRDFDEVDQEFRGSLNGGDVHVYRERVRRPAVSP